MVHEMVLYLRQDWIRSFLLTGLFWKSVDLEIMSEELRSDCFGYGVVCTVCGRTKAPVGRSVPVELCMCDHDCAGYDQEPLPSHLWPRESEADFGYKVPR